MYIRITYLSIYIYIYHMHTHTHTCYSDVPDDESVCQTPTWPGCWTFAGWHWYPGVGAQLSMCGSFLNHSLSFCLSSKWFATNWIYQIETWLLRSLASEVLDVGTWASFVVIDFHRKYIHQTTVLQISHHLFQSPLFAGQGRGQSRASRSSMVGKRGGTCRAPGVLILTNRSCSKSWAII